MGVDHILTGMTAGKNASSGICARDVLFAQIGGYDDLRALIDRFVLIDLDDPPAESNHIASAPLLASYYARAAGWMSWAFARNRPPAIRMVRNGNNIVIAGRDVRIQT
jgi:hypothetical protein